MTESGRISGSGRRGGTGMSLEPGTRRGNGGTAAPGWLADAGAAEDEDEDEDEVAGSGDCPVALLRLGVGALLAPGTRCGNDASPFSPIPPTPWGARYRDIPPPLKIQQHMMTCGFNRNDVLWRKIYVRPLIASGQQASGDAEFIPGRLRRCHTGC
jgi:hypothetical protein